MENNGKSYNVRDTEVVLFIMFLSKAPQLNLLLHPSNLVPLWLLNSVQKTSKNGMTMYVRNHISLQ